MLVDKTIHLDPKTSKLTIKNVPQQLQQKILELNNNAE
jgi:nucleoid-associated protein YejK